MSFLADEGESLPIFEHNRLEDKPYAFRLIQLFPASDTGQEISCKLVPSDLEELPNYKALSYVWGDATATRNIYIEGKPYPVTKNCYTALVCLRHQTTQITLWIDAICINQRDPEEKNQQLSIMIDIYAEAEETLIWMGFNNTPWKEVSSLDRLRYIEKLVVTTIIGLTSSSDTKDSKARYNAILIEPAEPDILLVWGALIAIFSHTWWTRLWVHQELVAAQKATVVVGLHAFAWDLFLPLLKVLGGSGWEYSAADLVASPKLRTVAVGYCRLVQSSGYQGLATRSLARNQEEFRLSIVQQRNLEKMLSKPTWSSTIAIDLKITIETMTAGRKFLRTNRGFMGLAPQVAEVGDEVWVILGCNVPMLLRKCDDYYMLVGECFVYGIMEGEQTKDLLASGPPKKITLR
ncbi:hypothetical protein N431DRAFT_407479 [Stipitochalara longipes BDJ]|nr:hypothetical protein N431DRAFT_407479 [Stipitochalara longipes BDJ]